MTGMNLSSVVSIAFNTIGANKTVAEMKKVVMAAQFLNKGGKDSTLHGELARIANSKGGIKKLNAEIGKMSMRPFRMELLSTMFFSMMVWRQMTSLFRSMIETIKVLGGKFHPINLAITKMAVGWEIVKYTLINALTPVFIQIADWLIWLAEALQDMDPDKLEVLAYSLLVIAGIAGFGLLASQLGLFWDGLLKLLGVSSVANLASLKSLYNVLNSLGGLAAITLIVTSVFDFMKPDKILLAIGKAMAGVSWWIPGPWGLAVGAIGLALQMLDVIGGSGGQDWSRWLTEFLVIGKAFAYNPTLGVWTLGSVILFEGIKFGKGIDAQVDVLKKFQIASAESVGLDTTGLKSWKELLTMYAEILTGQKKIDTEVKTAEVSLEKLSAPATQITGEINAAGMTASALNAELSREIHKTIYIHVQRSGTNASVGSTTSSPVLPWNTPGAFSGKISGQNQFALGGGASVVQ